MILVVGLHDAALQLDGQPIELRIDNGAHYPKRKVHRIFSQTLKESSVTAAAHAVPPKILETMLTLIETTCIFDHFSKNYLLYLSINLFLI